MWSWVFKISTFISGRLLKLSAEKHTHELRTDLCGTLTTL